MKITPSVRKAVSDALKTKGLQRQELAECMGVSKSWVTKFLAGHIKNLTDDSAKDMERCLGLRFYRVSEFPVSQTDLAGQFSTLIDRNPLVAKIAASILELVDGDTLRRVAEDQSSYKS